MAFLSGDRACGLAAGRAPDVLGGASSVRAHHSAFGLAFRQTFGVMSYVDVSVKRARSAAAASIIY